MKAQAGLQIDNTTDPCGVWVTMYGSLTGMGITADLPPVTYSNQFYVPAFTLRVFATPFPWDFTPGWLSIVTPIVPSEYPTDNFHWSDVAFQFDCDGICPNTGGTMSDLSFSGSAFTAPSPWVGPGGCRHAVWIDAAPYTPWTQVIIRF